MRPRSASDAQKSMALIDIFVFTGDVPQKGLKFVLRLSTFGYA